MAPVALARSAPDPGSRRPETILDSVAAAELELTPEERDAIAGEALG